MEAYGKPHSKFLVGVLKYFGLITFKFVNQKIFSHLSSVKGKEEETTGFSTYFIAILLNSEKTIPNGKRKIKQPTEVL